MSDDYFKLKNKYAEKDYERKKKLLKLRHDLMKEWLNIREDASERRHTERMELLIKGFDMRMEKFKDDQKQS